MIEAQSGASPFAVRLSNGSEIARADATSDKGGSGEGFRPHELLEAALASCMNMSLRMYAERHSLPLEHLVVRVRLDRGGEEQAVFRYSLELEGRLSHEQRAQLLQVAEDCPVRRTLLRGFSFASAAPAVSNNTLQPTAPKRRGG
jgi:putative redox protein